MTAPVGQGSQGVGAGSRATVATETMLAKYGNREPPALEEFKRFLIRKYGNFLRAWYAMDRDANGRLSYHEFAVAARTIGYNGDLRVVFNSLDKAGKDYLVLDELDPHASRLLYEFAGLIHKNFGTARDAYYFALDRDQNQQIYYEEFRDASERIGFKGDARALFKCLDLDGNGFITLDELEWAVNRWHSAPKEREDLDPRNWGLKVSPPIRSRGGKKHRRPRGKFSASNNTFSDETRDNPSHSHAHEMRVGVFGSEARFGYQRNKNNAIARREALRDLVRGKTSLHTGEGKAACRFENYQQEDVDICFENTKRSIEQYQFKPYYDSKGERDMSIVSAFRAGLPAQLAGTQQGPDELGHHASKQVSAKKGALMSQQFSATGDYTPWNHLTTGGVSPQKVGLVSLQPRGSTAPSAGVGSNSLLRTEVKTAVHGKQAVIDNFNRYFAPRREGYGMARGLGHMTAR